MAHDVLSNCCHFLTNPDTQTGLCLLPPGSKTSSAAGWHTPQGLPERVRRQNRHRLTGRGCTIQDGHTPSCKRGLLRGLAPSARPQPRCVCLLCCVTVFRKPGCMPSSAAAAVLSPGCRLGSTSACSLSRIMCLESSSSWACCRLLTMPGSLHDDYAAAFDRRRLAVCRPMPLPLTLLAAIAAASPQRCIHQA